MRSASKPGRSRWFIQLFQEADLRRLGRVCLSGGTDDRTPYPWVELSTDDCPQMSLQARLAEAGVPVRKVLRIDPGQGRLLARQLELFAC